MSNHFAFIGTYTTSTSKGIYVYKIDPNTGTWTQVATAATTNPTFLALHPNKRFLYAVNENGSGAITAYAIDPNSGALTELNTQPTHGTAPCHVTVDATGQCAYVANYGDGKILAYRIEADGRLSPNTELIQNTGSSVDKDRQQSPHAHSVNIDPNNRYLFACDLGLDKVMIYRLDLANGKLAPNAAPFAVLDPGAGPRHFAFHPNHKYAYAINEMGNTVTAFTYHEGRGGLATLQVISTLPEGYKETSYCADIHVHPSGKWLYGSNRGHDSIAIFAIQEDGTLKLAGIESVRGNWPRNFALSPDGMKLYVANERTDNIVVFDIDQSNGLLNATGQEISVPKPVCIKFG